MKNTVPIVSISEAKRKLYQDVQRNHLQYVFSHFGMELHVFPPLDCHIKLVYTFYAKWIIANFNHSQLILINILWSWTTYFSVNVISECCTHKECCIRNAWADAVDWAQLYRKYFCLDWFFLCKHAAVLWDKPKDILTSWFLISYSYYFSSVFQNLYSIQSGTKELGTDRIWYSWCTEPQHF